MHLGGRRFPHRCFVALGSRPVAGMPLDGLGVLSGSTLLTTQSPSTGLSNGETDDHRSVANSVEGIYRPAEGIRIGNPPRNDRRIALSRKSALPKLPGG